MENQSAATDQDIPRSVVHEPPSIKAQHRDAKATRRSEEQLRRTRMRVDNAQIRLDAQRMFENQTTMSPAGSPFYNANDNADGRFDAHLCDMVAAWQRSLVVAIETNSHMLMYWKQTQGFRDPLLAELMDERRELVKLLSETRPVFN